MALRLAADSREDAEFRATFRGWLARELPNEYRHWGARPPNEIIVDWHKRLYRGGYVAPHWPKKYGGSELPITQQAIVREELALAGAPELMCQGLQHIGPLLMACGNEEQKKRHLPPILPREIDWAQGYSEPNSGSDLASLRTRAELKGDRFIVNGQKIWTHGAMHADWIFFLARSDPEAKPQAGISFLLSDIRAPGITVRPIRTIADDDALAEVFFDNVEVPAENLVGKLHDGWRVANVLLSTERISGGTPSSVIEAFERLKAVARTTGMDADPVFRDRMAQAEIDLLAVRAGYQHAVGIVAAGEPLGADVSFLKSYQAELLQHICDLMLEAAGAIGIERGWLETPDGRMQISQLYRQVRRATIYGGSNEIQKNIVARRVLDLPSWRGG
jgi:alkylation response protein AidB-like acyl-CoA dehydrogenase